MTMRCPVDPMDVGLGFGSHGRSARDPTPVVAGTAGAGTMLPMILFAGGVVYLNHMHEREAAFDRVLETVRGVRHVLDAEVQGITAGLEVLAASPASER